MDIVDRIELFDGLCDTDEEKDSQDLRRCYLVGLQNPFEKFDDCGFQMRFRFSEIAVQRLFSIIYKKRPRAAVCQQRGTTNVVTVAVLEILCKGSFPTDWLLLDGDKSSNCGCCCEL